MLFLTTNQVNQQRQSTEGKKKAKRKKDFEKYPGSVAVSLYHYLHYSRRHHHHHHHHRFTASSGQKQQCTVYQV